MINLKNSLKITIGERRKVEFTNRKKYGITKRENCGITKVNGPKFSNSLDASMKETKKRHNITKDASASDKLDDFIRHQNSGVLQSDSNFSSSLYASVSENKTCLETTKGERRKIGFTVQHNSMVSLINELKISKDENSEPGSLDTSMSENKINLKITEGECHKVEFTKAENYGINEMNGPKFSNSLAASLEENKKWRKITKGERKKIDFTVQHTSVASLMSELKISKDEHSGPGSLDTSMSENKTSLKITKGERHKVGFTKRKNCGITKVNGPKFFNSLDASMEENKKRRKITKDASASDKINYFIKHQNSGVLLSDFIFASSLDGSVSDNKTSLETTKGARKKIDLTVQHNSVISLINELKISKDENSDPGSLDTSMSENKTSLKIAKDVNCGVSFMKEVTFSDPLDISVVQETEYDDAMKEIDDFLNESW